MPETLKDWEVVQENVGESKTERLKIVHGWLYKVTTLPERSVALVFVPEKGATYQ